MSKRKEVRFEATDDPIVTDDSPETSRAKRRHMRDEDLTASAILPLFYSAKRQSDDDVVVSNTPKRHQTQLHPTASDDLLLPFADELTVHDIARQENNTILLNALSKYDARYRPSAPTPKDASDVAELIGIFENLSLYRPDPIKAPAQTIPAMENLPSAPFQASKNSAFSSIRH